MAFLLFGLTGGIASGKSTVAERFREQGLPVIDADQVARDVVSAGSPALAEIVALFGEQILDGEGALDRAQLRERVFADARARAELNAIIHPRIAIETRRRAGELAAEGVTLACYEAALLVENGLADAFRPLVVVSLPPALQRARLASRDGMTVEQAEAMIAAQLPLADKVALADYVIENSGDRAALEAQADAVFRLIRASVAGEGER